MNEPVDAITFQVIALHLYTPFGSASITPVHIELAVTVPVDKSKFTYPPDI